MNIRVIFRISPIYSVYQFNQTNLPDLFLIARSFHFPSENNHHEGRISIKKKKLFEISREGSGEGGKGMG